MPDRLLTTKELQNLLQLDRVTIYKLVKGGELPAMRVGGQWRFSEPGVRAWMLQRQGARAAAPGSAENDDGERPSLSLAELISIQTLQTIQNQFAHLLGVASFTLDVDGTPFVGCSRCSPFCQLVHSTAEGWDACGASWREMVAAPEPGSAAAIYLCHAGIHYASAPITVDGERMGMVTAGQFLTPDVDQNKFRQKAVDFGKRIGVDGHALAEATSSLEIVSSDRALQITGLLATIANTLSSIGYQSYQLRQKLERIAEISGGNRASAV